MKEGDRDDDGPKITLQRISLSRGTQEGVWVIAWRVENLDPLPIRLDAARFPHSQFKADEQQFQPNLILGYKEAVQFESTVVCAEPAGSAIENAFIIFSVVWLERHWRIFVRLRILVDDQGKPVPLTEAITTQQVGFSKALRPES